MVELGDFLRSSRAALKPTDVGSPETTFRRVSGLRREEVAQLAGVSTDYYIRLEQGRDLKPSDVVVDALATAALDVDEAGRAHLHHLAHPKQPADQRRSHAVQRVRTSVHAMLDSWTDQAGFILGRRGDVLATKPCCGR